MMRGSFVLPLLIFYLVKVPTSGSFISSSTGFPLPPCKPPAACEPTRVLVRSIPACRGYRRLVPLGMLAVHARNEESSRRTRSYNHILQQCARERDHKKATEVLAAMAAAGIVWDVYTYNAVLNCFCHPSTHKFQVYPMELMGEMSAKAVRPNVITVNTALKYFVLRKDLDGAMKLVEDMQEEGIEPDLITYNILINICASSGRMETASELFERLQLKRLVPDSRTITTMIKGYGQLRELKRAEEVAARRPQDQSVQRTLAAQLIAEGKISRALSTLLNLFELDEPPTSASSPPSASSSCLLNVQLVQKKPLKPSEMEVATLNTLLLAYREQKDLDKSLDLLGYAQKHNLVVDEVTFNTLIDTCGLAGRADLVRGAISAYMGEDQPVDGACEVGGSDSSKRHPAEEILLAFAHQLAAASERFQQLHESNVCKMYTSLIRGLGRQAGADARHRLAGALEEYKEKSGRAPDATMLTATMDAVVNQGDAEEAKSFFEQVLPSLRASDVSVVNAYMKVLSQEQDMSRLQEFLSLIENSGIRPDVVTFNTALHICCEMNNTQGASEVLDMMEKKRVKRDLTTYNTLLLRCAKNKNVKEATRLLDCMQSDGIRPNDLSYSLMCDVSGKVGDVARAKEMFMQVSDDAPQEIKQNCYSALVRGYSVNGQIEEALKLAAAASRTGIALPESGWLSILDAYANIGATAKVMKIVEDIRAAGGVIGPQHWSLVIKSMCMQEDSKGAYAIMKQHIKHADLVCYNTLIRASVRAGDSDTLILILRDIEQQGLVPDEHTSRALSQSGKSAGLLKVSSLLRMFDANFKKRLLSVVE
uniref:PROP1-like PPR domain-containing protein n=2 Tax=Guillardia theta TaxID=55529 RepID=A0A7S4KL42_GUITH